MRLPGATAVVALRRCSPSLRVLQEEGRRGRWRRTEARKKPIVIGITADASGQYANSGDSDKRGMLMAIKEWNAKGGVLGRPDQGGAPRHRDHAGHRLARGRATDQAREGGVSRRRDELGRRERHLAGGAEIRRHLPQHQLELALRVGRELPPRQVRVGRQRHQLRPGQRQGRHRQVRQDAGCSSPTTTSGVTTRRTRPASSSTENGGKIVGRDHGPAGDARFQRHPAQGAAAQSPRSSPRRSAATTSRRCARRSRR